MVHDQWHEYVSYLEKIPFCSDTCCTFCSSAILSKWMNIINWFFLLSVLKLLIGTWMNDGTERAPDIDIDKLPV